MYKIRDVIRRTSRQIYPDPSDPGHGTSPYDGLSFWLKSTIRRRDMKILFHREGEIIEYLSTLPEPEGKRNENLSLFPGECVTLRITAPSGHVAEACFAPSFKRAWQIIRQDFPCNLVIENGYSTEHLNIQQL